jgi:transposase
MNSPTAAPLPTADHLPDDPAYLKHLIVNLVKLLRESRHENEGLRERIDELVRRLLRLPRPHANPAQPWLFPELLAQLGLVETPTGVVVAPTTSPEKKAKPRGRPHGRGPLPAHLERVRIEHRLSDSERACPGCGVPRDVLSEQTSEQLDYRPAALFVNEHVRFTYICKSCAQGQTPAGDTAVATAQTPADEGAVTTDPCDIPVSAALTESSRAGSDRVVVADPAVPWTRTEELRLLPAGAPVPHTLTRSPLAAQPIERGLPGPGLLAYIGVSKFADHLPLYRLEAILSRLGVEVARSTMCDWLAAGAELLRPLVELMKRRLLLAHVLHTDDTVVPLRDAAGDEHLKSRLWTYLGDRQQPYTVFDYTRTHQRDGPDTFLQGFHGYLQADAYSGYDGLYIDPRRGIREVACWAHARRKFADAQALAAVPAAEALAFIRRLYDLEDEALRLAGGDAERLEAERLRRRQRDARPILEQFHTWLLAQRDALLPKHKLSEAVNYVLNNWEAFVRYTEDGALAIDNNVAERALRRVGIGRKNYLFFGADSGGHTAAAWYSMIASCERHGLEPWRYLRDVLGRLGELRDPLRRATRTNDAAARDALLEPLLPDIWKASHPEALVPDVHNLGRPHRRR